MSWLPTRGMWFTAVSLDTLAGAVDQDLSIDGGGPPGTLVPVAAATTNGTTWWVLGAMIVAGLGWAWVLWRPARPKAGPA